MTASSRLAIQPGTRRHPSRRPPRGGHPGAWLLTAAVVVALAIGVVLVTGMRPDYDAFGWMVWGKQVLHWNLNTDGAPSWKPLTFLFTLPYALAGHAQIWLWMVTAVGGALAGSVFGARIAYRLTGPCPERPWAPYVAGAFTGISLLGLATYPHLVLIANSDPLIVTLCLAAIDAHLCGRHRLAFWLLVLGALGRPEVWPLVGLYALWMWRGSSRTVPVSLIGLLLIPVAWFTVPALTSHSWFIAGDLALHQRTVIHGAKIPGVISRLRSLYELPMQIAVLGSVAVAVWRRDRAVLVLTGAVLLWVVVEIAFAFHGWSAVNRYLIEPAAVLVVVAGVGVGRVLTILRPPVARWLGPAAVVALVAALVPVAHTRARQARIQYDNARAHTRVFDRLEAVVNRIGGPAAIKSCGQPTSLVGFQSTIAWVVGLNVGDVGYHPGRAIRRGDPIVLFKPHDLGWQVRLYNIPASRAARCRALRTDSAMG